MLNFGHAADFSCGKHLIREVDCANYRHKRKSERKEKESSPLLRELRRSGEGQMFKRQMR